MLFYSVLQQRLYLLNEDNGRSYLTCVLYMLFTFAAASFTTWFTTKWLKNTYTSDLRHFILTTQKIVQRCTRLHFLPEKNGQFDGRGYTLGRSARLLRVSVTHNVTPKETNDHPTNKTLKMKQILKRRRCWHITHIRKCTITTQNNRPMNYAPPTHAHRDTVGFLVVCTCPEVWMCNLLLPWQLHMWPCRKDPGGVWDRLETKESTVKDFQTTLW